MKSPNHGWPWMPSLNMRNIQAFKLTGQATVFWSKKTSLHHASTWNPCTFTQLHIYSIRFMERWPYTFGAYITHLVILKYDVPFLWLSFRTISGAQTSVNFVLFWSVYPFVCTLRRNSYALPFFRPLLAVHCSCSRRSDFLSIDQG